MVAGGKKPPVGAHYGLTDWLIQRASAVVLVLAAGLLFAALLLAAPQGFEAWRGFVMQGWVRIVLLLAVLALVWHAFIGGRDIYMDYLKNDVLRLVKIIALAIYLLVCLLWAASILL